MSLAELLPPWGELAALAAIAAVAGVLRGFSGFGAALVMAPGFALVIDPKAGVGMVTLLNVATAAQLFIPALRHTRWRLVAPLSVSACLAYPAGLALLVALDPSTVRRAIGATVLVCAALLLSGYRLKKGFTPLRTWLVGAASGALTGLTSAGGPPTILYLLSGDDAPARTRADFVVFFTIMQVFAIPSLLLADIVTMRTAATAALLTPVYMAATHVGVRLFAIASAAVYRRGAVFILLALGALTLLA